MALRGNLQDFGTTQLLNLVHLARRTGALQFQRDPKASELFFRDGKLIHAMASGRDGQLTSMLVTAGKLTSEQAKAIETRSKDMDDKRLALILIQNGYISKEDVVPILMEHIRTNLDRYIRVERSELLEDDSTIRSLAYGIPDNTGPCWISYLSFPIMDYDHLGANIVMIISQESGEILHVGKLFDD